MAEKNQADVVVVAMRKKLQKLCDEEPFFFVKLCDWVLGRKYHESETVTTFGNPSFIEWVLSNGLAHRDGETFIQFELDVLRMLNEWYLYYHQFVQHRKGASDPHQN